MITVFCPKCFGENKQGDEFCRHCGTKLDEEIGDYVEKLIKFSLHHPVPSVPPMAAEILGKIGDRRAVEPLIEVLKSTRELGLQESATEALGRLGDPRAVPVLVDILNRGPLVARLKAVVSLRQIGGTEAICALKWTAEHNPSRAVREEALAAVADVEIGECANGD